MRTALRTAALAVAFGLAACQEPTVPDLNAVTTDLINGGLSRSTVASLETGLANIDRSSTNSAPNFNQRYLAFVETMARDVYRLDPAESRYVSEVLTGPAASGGFVGDGAYNQYYTAIRTANLVIDSIASSGRDGLPSTQRLSVEEQRGATGFARTMKALAYWRVLETRDSIGIPIDVDRSPNAAPAPIVCKTDALAYLSALLDSAYADLQAAGPTFPFRLPSGYSSFGVDLSTPAGFAQFNRGLAGKVELYRGLDHHRPDASAFARAIADLDASFLSTTGSTDDGAYYTFSTAQNETVNPTADNALHLNPSVAAQLLPGDRRGWKIITGAGPYSMWGVTTTVDATIAIPNTTNLTRPRPLMKNAELVLLRAQAEIEQGDLTAATADINYVHVTDGGLPPYAVFTDKQSAIDAVLYEKRYSMLLESGHRLVDLRAYGRLNATYLTRETPSDPFQAALPLPSQVVQARNGNVTPVCSG